MRLDLQRNCAGSWNWTPEVLDDKGRDSVQSVVQVDPDQGGIEDSVVDFRGIPLRTQVDQQFVLIFDYSEQRPATWARVGSRLGLRISNFASKNPSNVRICLAQHFSHLMALPRRFSVKPGYLSEAFEGSSPPEGRPIPNSVEGVSGLAIANETPAKRAGRKEIGNVATAA